MPSKLEWLLPCGERLVVLILIYVFLVLRDGTEVSSLDGHHTSLEGLGGLPSRDFLCTLACVSSSCT